MLVTRPRDAASGMMLPELFESARRDVGVGAALVIDGVHYPSDVVASIVWGIVVAPLARMLWVSVVLRRVDGFTSRRARHI